MPKGYFDHILISLTHWMVVLILLLSLAAEVLFVLLAHSLWTLGSTPGCANVLLS